MLDDRAVRAMVFIALGLVVLYLVLVASAMVLGVIGSPAPRTAAERDLDQAELTVQRGDHTAKGLANYVIALTGVEQYRRAQDVIDSAPNSVKGTATGDLELAQTMLYYAQKDYPNAIRSADAATKVVKAAYEADLKKPGLNASKSYGINENYSGLLLLKAMCQQASGQAEPALKSYDEYLSNKPMESNVLVYRAQVKMVLKDAAGAKADVTAALRYDPSNQLALDELKKIGAK